MAYGTQVNFNGVNMVSVIDPVIYVDVIMSASGTRTYQLPTGYKLQYLAGVNDDNTQPTVTINGGTISWKNASSIGFIYVFYGR